MNSQEQDNRIMVLGSPTLADLAKLPPDTPAVCSAWDKPGPIELGRLAGLDLEDCALFVRTTADRPATCSEMTIKAILSAHIICIGANTTFTNRAALEEVGLLVLEDLSLDALPRAGFCVSPVKNELHACVRTTRWLS